MTCTDAGAPPASIGAYIEAMLKELADLADQIEDAALAASIRHARMAAASAIVKTQTE